MQTETQGCVLARNWGMCKKEHEQKCLCSLFVKILLTFTAVGFLILPWLLFVLVLVVEVNPASARDGGQFVGSPLKTWFDKLASGKGLCCSFADGISVQDVDWDTKDGHYRVFLNKQWVVVPDVAIVTEPNRFGPAIVWPYQDMNGVTQIRCFIPGGGT